jgi:hypothetical protein
MSEKDKLRISFSEYSTYMQCQHKWMLQYYLRLPGDLNEELVFGKSVHGTIETILTNSFIQKLYKVDKEKVVRDVFKGVLKDELETIEDIDFLKKFKTNNLGQIFMFQAEKLLKELDYFTRFKDYTVSDVEFKLDGLKLAENDKCEIIYKGFIDLVLKHKDGTYLILDWKTSKKKWDIEKKIKDNPDFFAQLCLYKYFYAREKNISYEDIYTKFFNLPRDEPKAVDIYNGSLDISYIDNFMSRFTSVCYDIYEKRKKPKDFTKIKMVTKKNFCYRCKFNTADRCDDINQHQILPLEPRVKES